MRNTIWIVGKNNDNNGNWDFQGAFSDLEKAEKACKSINDFVGPVFIDQELPQEKVDWPGSYYPLRE